MDLAVNINQGLPLPSDSQPDSAAEVRGDYLYYHYGCDGQDDRGWGCGYRTLQTLCSWVRTQLATHSQGKSTPPVPSMEDIQQGLVTMGDKSPSFVGSRDWIGSVEVGLTVDYLYDVPCKIVHIANGRDLEKHIDQLEEHFSVVGSPVMMGGDSDASSKGILGVCRGQHQCYLLILDPHYYGPKPDQQTLVDRLMLLWRPVDTFMENSFYNLCLPQLKAR